MKKRDIEGALRRTGESMPGAQWDVVSQTPVQRMEVHDSITLQPFIRRRNGKTLLVAALLALILCAGTAGVWWRNNLMVYSTLYVEVNPAFAIALNRGDRVLSVEARNEDAEVLLEGRSYRDWSLEAALGGLVDDLAAAGYVGAAGDIQLRVESHSDDRAKVLELEAAAMVAEHLAEPLAPAPTQTPVADPQVSTPVVPDAVHHGAEMPKGSEQLSPRQVREVIWTQVPDACIEKVELDEDDGVWYYEVEFTSDGVECEVEIHAISGEILVWEEKHSE